MTIPDLLAAALAGLGVLLGLLLTLILGARGSRLRHERRHRAQHEHVRSAVLAMLAGSAGAVPAGVPEDILLEVTVALLEKIRGEDREVLVDLLDRLGVVDRARRRTYRRGAVGRARAAALLGTAGVRRALPELARLLRDRDPLVREVSAQALGKLGDAGAAPFLLGALEEPRPLPAALAATALRRLGTAAEPALVAGLRAPAGTARTVCAELLGLHGSLAAVDDLHAALSDAEPAVRTAAARALGRIGVPLTAPAGAALLAVLAVDDAGSARTAAARGLGAIGDEGAVAALAAALGDRDALVAHAAAAALVRCGPAGRGALLGLAAGPSTAAGHAREALETAELADAARSVG